MTEAPAPGLHHGLDADEVVLALGTDAHEGLSSTEAATRLEGVGPNALPRAHRHSAFVRFLQQFHHPLLYVLLASAAATALVGKPVDASVIVAVVLVNAVIGFVQESRAEGALEALVAMTQTVATVVRDGQKHRLASVEIVPGDLVLLEGGDKVPADLRLARTQGLQVDESALTGESLPVDKGPSVLATATALPDRLNMAYSGTLVTSGRGAGVVVATGAGTEIGLIHRLVGEATGVQTPLTRKIARFSSILTVAILALAGVTFLIGVARGEQAADMLVAAVALAVGAIPEGLPAVVTITLAIGVARMARRHAIVRKLPAVETLGSTTVICTDKTGTLTENQMTVAALVTAAGTYEVTGTGYAPDGEIRDGTGPVRPGTDVALDDCLLAGLACNDARLIAVDGRWDVVGDPTEGALVTAAAKAGLHPDSALVAFPRVAAVPFESERRYMATLHRQAPGEPGRLYVKGAAEGVLGMCVDQRGSNGLPEPLDAPGLLARTEDLAGRALRVLAFATAEVAADVEEITDDMFSALGLTFLGLQAMHDPPRPEAVAAVRACQTAGIQVKMITGDHAATARAIAAQVGLDPSAGGAPQVMTGTDIDACSDDALPEAVERTAVFARVSPEHKLRLVLALQQRGHVVAMTGDGVNDAPAIKQADIGIAMGSGTEVAKEAAEMVLTDDNFASIEAAVEEGRGVFDNLVKFFVWALPTNVALGIGVLIGMVAGTELPLLPVQILWLNMTTAGVMGVALALEPSEGDIMRRPPRDPSRPILSRELVTRMLLVAGILVVGAFGLFDWELARGASEAEARTVVVNVFAMTLAAYLLNCRSLERSVLQVGLFSNRWVWVGIGAMVAVQLTFTYLPVMHDLFESAPIDGAGWARVLGVALVGFAAVGAEKRLRRALHERRTRSAAEQSGTEVV
jgi:magnesium-transporting ATPase (P-type)